MSKYQQTIETCNRVCPYCHNSYQVENAECLETTRIEECEECGKKYHAYEMITVDHYAEPDCELNDQEHQWEPIQLSNDSFYDFCSICGKIRPGKPIKGYLKNV